MLRAHIALAGLGMLAVVSGCGRVEYGASADGARGMDAASIDAASSGLDATGDDAGADAGPGASDAGPAPVDAGPAAIDAAPGDAGPTDGGLDDGAPPDVGTCECTPGQTRTCSDCRPDVATSTCTAACRWGACLTAAGEPCGACDDGAFHCDESIGRGYACESGRWTCTCACSGGPFCC